MNTLELSSSLRTFVSTIHRMVRVQATSISKYSMTEKETVGHLMRNPRLLPSELTNLTKVKAQSMSQILNNLEEQGIIKRTPSKNDRRKVYISLTTSGKKKVQTAKTEWDEYLNEIIEKSLSKKEKELLIKALPVLNKLIKTT